MNFTTDLPKKDPIVSYIVASAVKCEKFFPGCSKEGPIYRMHAVIMTKKNIPSQTPESISHKANTNERKGSLGVSSYSGRGGNGRKWIPAQNATSYILCHIRKVAFSKNSSEEEEEKLGVLEELDSKLDQED